MVEWLAGNRIRGTSTERTTGSGFNPVDAVTGGWKELARTTLGSAGDTISVASLADKQYYMVLGNHLPSGNFRTTYRINNDSSGSEGSSGTYALRKSEDGNSENVTGSQIGIYLGNQDTNTDYFDVSYLQNISTDEKFMINHNMRTGGSGAGAYPRRVEAVAKWSNTSDAINRIDAINDQGGNYASGSEVVVLGYDPDDTHTTNFWEELASVTATGSTTSFNSGTFTAKKYLWVQGYFTSANAFTPQIRVGNGSIDDDDNYAGRRSYNGGADVTAIDQSEITLDGVSADNPVFFNGFIVNNASNEKLAIFDCIKQYGTTSATAPARRETVFKWANTSNQINIIEFLASSGNIASTGTMKVWGSN